MNGIEFTTRFIAYLPDTDKHGHDELALTASLVGETDLAIVRRAPYLLAVSRVKPSAHAEATRTFLDIFPGTARSARMAARKFNAAASMKAIHQAAEASAQCYNVLRAAPTRFTLESDMLGLKPVYSARTPGGTVLASRIADVLSLFPDLAQPGDHVGLYEMLGFWAPLGRRTLYRRIHRTLSGGGYQWTPATGLSGRRVRSLQPMSVQPYWYMDNAIARVRDASCESLREKMAGAPAPTWLALSGGFDSRFIAALCGDLGIKLRAASYGRPQHREWRSTKGVARALGLDLTMLRQDRDATLRYLPNHLDATEGNADCGSVSSLNLLGVPAAMGSTLLHGFCGDLLSGGHLDVFSANDYASRETLTDAIIRHWCPPAAANPSSLFTPAPSMDEVRQDVLDGLRSDCPPYQAFLLWYAENRTRRYVASHFAVLGEHFDTVMPFYDRELFELWFSIPPIGLSGQVTLRKMFARCYPALARIPHAEDPAPIIPNLRWQVSRLWHGLPRRALTQCLGPALARQLLRTLYRDDDFRSLSKLAAPQQQAHMLSSIAALRSALRDELGVELSPDYERALSGNLLALRAMFTAASYAQRQHGCSRARVEHPNLRIDHRQRATGNAAGSVAEATVAATSTRRGA